MRRSLLSLWQAGRAVAQGLSVGGALLLLSVLGTVAAALLWLEVSLIAAILAYAVTIAVTFVVTRHLTRGERQEARAASGERREANGHAAKKVVSSR
jgi:Na+/melibiose symporter-like transporter